MINNPTILVPWDFSEHSQMALEYAACMTTPKNIRVLCVLERPDPYAHAVLYAEWGEDDARKRCQQKFLETVDQTRNPDLSFEIRFGEPPNEIIRYAKETAADMILISTHGRTGVKRIFLGSVAQRVSQLASCPVLLLPNDWFETAKKKLFEKSAATS